VYTCFVIVFHIVMREYSASIELNSSSFRVYGKIPKNLLAALTVPPDDA